MTTVDTQLDTDVFVARVSAICRRDNGRRAALRRGLGRSPDEALGMHATVAPYLPAALRGGQERAYYTVAALIAASIRSTDEDDADTEQAEPPARRTNLGHAFAAAVIRVPRPAMSRDTAEKRLHLVVRQSQPGVHRQITAVTRHLIIAEIRMDWGQLLHDLRDWTVRRDAVAKRWLQTYYRSLESGAQNTEPTR